MSVLAGSMLRPLCVLLLAGAVLGQAQISLRGIPRKIRVGEPVRGEIVISGVDSIGEPELPKSKDLRLAIVGQRIGRSIINGVASVEVRLELEIIPLRTGEITLPPIAVKSGGLALKTRPRALEVLRSVTGADLGTLTVRVDKSRVYVHETVTFDVICGISGGLQLVSDLTRNGQKYFRVFVESDWLAEPGFGEPVDAPETGSDRPRIIALNRNLQPADLETKDDQNRFRFKKTVLPTKAGKYALDGPTMRFSVIQDTNQKDLFGRRIQTSRDYVALGQPIELEVVALPAAGRPDPFFGGVGQFKMSAAFDKPSVQVGGSVKLTLTIAGRGNTEQFRVPSLEALPGFHFLGKIENRTRERVEVIYDLSPKSVEVSGAPEIGWNYFHTEKETYESLSTPPVSLRVTPRVGETSLPDLPVERPDAVVPGVDDIHDVWFEDDHPVADFAGEPGFASSLASVLGPWLLCFLGMLFLRGQRRARADVAGRRARGALRKFQSAVAAEPFDALVGYLADRLGCESAAVIGPDLAERLTAAGVEPGVAGEASALVDAGVAARYGGSGGVDAQQASRVVEALEAATLATGSRAATAGLVLLAVAGVSGAVGAQDLSAAETAYRNGDYAAAAEGFQAAAAAGDRRAAYNLGNALFRQGLYARALVAYERARLAVPRDPELLANVRLTRERLELGTAADESFSDTVARARDRWTPMERLWACLLCHCLAGLLVCFGGRRLRIVGLVLALPGLVLAVELLVFLPQRPDRGIVVAPDTQVRAEPNPGLAPLLRVRAGADVELLGSGGGDWAQVRVRGRKGWIPSSAVARID